MLSDVGAMDAFAGKKNIARYASLQPCHSLVAVAIETFGAISARSVSFLNDLSPQDKTNLECKSQSFSVSR